MPAGPFTVDRFLAAISTVDDRAVSPHVLRHIRDHLGTVTAPRVLEIGVGLGAMALRLTDREILPPDTRYIGIDEDPALARAARTYLIEAGATPQDETIELQRGNGTVTVSIQPGDGYDALDAHAWDLVVANAFPESPAIPVLLDRLTTNLTPTGVCYLPVRYDGVTTFVPESSSDTAVLEAYHATVTECTGRTFLEASHTTDVRLVAADGADRIIHPTNGAYPADEAYALHHLIHGIDAAIPNTDPPPGMTTWGQRRHRQIDRAALTYIAHGIDLLFARP